jgi:RNA recognition motif-containing protein
MSTDNNLWMGDVQPWMDESFIMNAFNSYNFYPKNIKLIHDKLTRELKNYCFISFLTIEEANNCLLFLTGKTIPNTQIKFKLNWANYFSTFNKSIYVGNLSPDVDDISLYKLFKERYPSVHHASVIVDKGVSKGFGFIMFRGEEDYEKCLKEMNGVLFHGNIIKVNEQKKNNKYHNNNSNYDNINENENDEFSSSNENNNMDVVYNYEDKNNNYNILNNSVNNIFQNSSNKDTGNNLNNNIIIDFYRNKNGYKNNFGTQMNKNRFDSGDNILNPLMQNEYINSLQLNSINNPNIIHNVININNINKIQNINYINDINKIYNNNKIMAKNNNQINNNLIKPNENINTHNNIYELSNRQQSMLYLNNNQTNQTTKDMNINNNIIQNKDNNINNIIIEEKAINLPNHYSINAIANNDIMSQINSKILNNAFKNKKEKKVKYNLEILKNYDNKTFSKIISKKLDMMYKYYIEKYPYELNKMIISNMFIYYCQNEKQLNFYTNIF